MKRFGVFLVFACITAIAVAAEIGSYPTASSLVGSERLLGDQSSKTVNVLPSQLFTYVTTQLYPITSGEISCAATISSYSYPTGDFRRYGAVGDGNTDDTTAVQNAISCLPPTGGAVYCAPGGKYKITATLHVGNGSSSAASTQGGIRIEGNAAGNSFQPGFYNNTIECRFTWAGATSSAVIEVDGPVQGWAINNVLIDCASTAGSIGLSLLSAQFGSVKNMSFLNCVKGVNSTVVSAKPGGVGNVDSIHNSWDNITIKLPNITPAYGMVFTGLSGGVGNTDYNEVRNFFITFNSPAPGVQYGLYFQAEDNVRVTGGHFSNTAASNTTPLVFDYSVNATWPADTVITNVDFGNNNPPIINTSSPSGATLNRVISPSSTNGIHTDPGLANLYWDTTGQPVTIANLPTCSSSVNVGKDMNVSNGVASPTYMATPSTTGTTNDRVHCNGSGWVYD